MAKSPQSRPNSFVPSVLKRDNEYARLSDRIDRFKIRLHHLGANNPHRADIQNELDAVNKERQELGKRLLAASTIETSKIPESDYPTYFIQFVREVSSQTDLFLTSIGSVGQAGLKLLLPVGHGTPTTRAYLHKGLVSAIGAEVSILPNQVFSLSPEATSKYIAEYCREHMRWFTEFMQAKHVAFSVVISDEKRDAYVLQQERYLLNALNNNPVFARFRTKFPRDSYLTTFITRVLIGVFFKHYKNATMITTTPIKSA